MRVVNRDEFNLNRSRILTEVAEGAVFIHPTDTIYGIGCDATNPEAVHKIREIKSRYKRPFSVIAPSKNWIRENCEVTDEIGMWLQKLPGPYTLILKLKQSHCVAKEVLHGSKNIGIRIPEHWFSNVAMGLKRPIVTTSANKVGKPFMTKMENLDPEIKKKMDFAFYEGDKEAHPSTIVDLTGKKEKLTERTK